MSSSDPKSLPVKGASANALQTAGTPDVFWDKIAAEFNDLQYQLGHLTLPSRVDKDSFYASKILPDVSSTLHEKINAGYLMYPHEANSDYIKMLVSALDLVGHSVPDEYRESIPAFMTPHLEPKLSLVPIIEKSIRENRINTDFIVAWGAYNRAVATITTLLIHDDSARQYFRTYIEEGTPPKVIEQHIYSYWMYPRWVVKGENKMDCQNSLAEAINRELLKPHAEKRLGALLNILGGMIILDLEKSSSLKGRIINFPRAEIEKIFKNHAVPEIELPDLGW